MQIVIKFWYFFNVVPFIFWDSSRKFKNSHLKLQLKEFRNSTFDNQIKVALVYLSTIISKAIMLKKKPYWTWPLWTYSSPSNKGVSYFFKEKITIWGLRGSGLCLKLGYLSSNLPFYECMCMCSCVSVSVWLLICGGN